MFDLNERWRARHAGAGGTASPIVSTAERRHARAIAPCSGVFPQNGEVRC